MIDSAELERIDGAETIVEPMTPAKRTRTGALLIGLSILFLGTVFLSVGLFGVRASVVSGGSMQPRWHRGDIVITRSVDQSALKVGDVITFRVETTRVVHRITAVHETDRGPIFTTQGDNNPAADRPVPADDVEGKVISAVPAAGRPLLLIRSWLATIR